MKVYKCLCEAIDYGHNHDALINLKKLLEMIDDITVKEAFIEDGNPEEGAGAGWIIEIPEDKYVEANRKVRELTAYIYNVDEMFYRLGLGIIGEKEV